MRLSYFFEGLAYSRRWCNEALARLPSRCPLCQMQALGGLLCAGCDADTYGARQRRAICLTCALDLSGNNQCSRCRLGEQESHISALVCAFDYRFTGKSLIQMYKEGKQLALARLLGDLMVRAAQPVLQTRPPDAWVPVPASVARLGRNGFSPSQQLAQAVASKTGIACRLDWLRQVRENTPQKTLSLAQREHAVKNRFVANLAVSGCTVGLIDDVVTTASTVIEAARVLKTAGASQVIVLASARTPQRA